MLWKSRLSLKWNSAVDTESTVGFLVEYVLSGRVVHTGRDLRSSPRGLDVHGLSSMSLSIALHSHLPLPL